MTREQPIEHVHGDLALLYRLIETIAWWEGRLTTGHLMQSFGISRQQASKDINRYIIEHAPKNLTYSNSLTGYVPSKAFKPMLIDDQCQRLFSPAQPESRTRAAHRRAGSGLCPY